jgi:hypothetical protein
MNEMKSDHAEVRVGVMVRVVVVKKELLFDFQ